MGSSISLSDNESQTPRGHAQCADAGYLSPQRTTPAHIKGKQAGGGGLNRLSAIGVPRTKGGGGDTRGACLILNSIDRRIAYLAHEPSGRLTFHCPDYTYDDHARRPKRYPLDTFLSTKTRKTVVAGV